MALQASGQIKYSEIITEFGTPNNGGLGEYRISENVGSLSNLPLDTGVPQSGQIKFSDFYGKRLNQIVDLHSIGNNTVRQDAKDRWNNGNVHVVGSTKTGKTQPPDTIDDRVIINVNNTIGSAKGTQTHCAVKTGTWDSGTILEIEIGASGKLYGAGGDGGEATRVAGVGVTGTGGEESTYQGAAGGAAGAAIRRTSGFVVNVNDSTPSGINGVQDATLVL